ncbi:hypothetical protein [Amphibiibacter pelophylacis]|uniref:Uncharacterized protein n=1 Tax=Amphibiibacter pelophylacis TaxID=1799477 RepID=A0ACC6P5H2_9BURK
MSIAFNFIVVALLLAFAGSMAPSLMGAATVPLFGNEVRAASVVMCVAVFGALVCGSLACFVAILELRSRATKEKPDGVSAGPHWPS